MTKQKHPGMTNAEFRRLGEYVRWMADAMGLRDWYFNLKHSPPLRDDESVDKGAGARIEIYWGKRYADISVCEEFRTMRPDRQRQFICHELVHCHLDHLDSLTDNKLRDHMGEMHWQGWHMGFDLAFENAIDAIADAWARKLPLISWPKPKVKNGRDKRA